MENLIKRSISGVIYVAAFVSVFYLPGYFFNALMVILCYLSLIEVFALISKGEIPAIRKHTVAFLLSLILFVLANLNIGPFFMGFVNGVSVATIMVFSFWAISPQKTLPQFKFIEIFLLIYILVPISAALLFFKYGAINTGALHILLVTLILIWVNDTGAYVIGSLLGRHKIIPAHSPAKSWEGFIGGILLVVAVSLLYGYFFGMLNWPHWLAIGILVPLFSFTGDIFESRLKRMAGVKDSGGILPGHGGILDRLDSFLFVVPVIYFYFKIFIE